ncbi:MAG TPA: type I DNA topoisomerase [Acidimicrobiales bacterium]|nr:type I DNA topoisomerase [Acidimicrobiales bacterium]
MPKPLVIVESPAKAKTIASYLGNDYHVESSIGHIRDLPRNAADVPAAYKGEPWSRLGVDVDNDFKPLYVVSRDKKDQVRKLKALVKDASELYLATDEDREGESIAWHLSEVLAPRIPVKRMVFHEITRPAIERAVRDWRDLDRRLVDAQETRRVLDRLYGYEVSPVLWKKVMPALSAGRVQSPATRLLVERERARMRFVSASYWDLAGRFEDAEEGRRDGGAFGAGLVALDGRRLVSGRDFEEDGTVSAGRVDEVVRLDEDEARALAGRLEDSEFTVRSVDEKPWRRTPHAPFMTSTLQQEAGRKLRFSAHRTMRVAQDLYESGFITYMRTDSTTLSAEALSAARSQARALFGDAFVPAQPRRYDNKVKNAQEAHEAIRPAGDVFRTPDQTGLHGDQRRLYELVWMRTLASQMADAVGQSVVVRLGGESSTGEDAEFGTSGRVITFPGFLRAYVEGADDPDAELEDREVRLPALAVGDRLVVESLTVEGHATQPPARYTEASLVKALEDMGVGRPSTYSSILDTIQARGYVWKKGTALVPSWTAFAVIGLLERHFGELVDYGFTASMEEDLDEIASGDCESVPWLTRFYFGDGQPGLKQLVSDHLGQIDAREINSVAIGGPDSGVVVRVGRYGPYVQRGDERAPVPEDLAPDELTVARAVELLEAGSTDREVGVDPDSGLPVVVRAGRFGPYVQVGSPEDLSGKPRTASLLRAMDPATVTLEDALRLLSLPRVVGVDPSDHEEIVATNGRYGPYLKKGQDSRSLDSEDQLFTVGLDEALALFAQPKGRRGGGGSAAPLRELGTDPTSGAPILLKDGRFGPYVTDGTTNASLRKGDTVDGMTPDRAIELLADRRAAPPRAGRPAKRAGTKKGAAKKAATKKAAATRSGATNAAGASKGAGATKGAARKAPAGSTQKQSPARKAVPKKAAPAKAAQKPRSATTRAGR